MKRSVWNFLYAPPVRPIPDPAKPDVEHVVATRHDVDPARIAELLAPLVEEVAPLVSAHPLYWTRVRTREPLARAALVQRLQSGGIAVRYACRSRAGSHELAPPLDWQDARPRLGLGWQTRPPRSAGGEATAGHWFLGADGVAVDRRFCGTGAGTRLAVIDDDAGEANRLELDAEVLIGIDSVPRGSHHAGLLIGWAVGALQRTALKQKRRFSGVAPDASPRLYCIPRPRDVFSLPVAIVRAVDDGADVVLCATAIEDQTSPLLDDALEFASHVGRGRRGAVVIFPTGRDVPSAPRSMHASLTLSLGHPACDPRVLCVGPSGREGGWFVWRDAKGRLHPFANRGPSVRFLAPGDDMGDPFGHETQQLRHAESSGASAVAAGVALLLIGACPEIACKEVGELLARTCSEVNVGLPDPGPIADTFDFLPLGADRDGHNAKTGYGRLQATRACLSALDPIAAALVAIGEDDSARAYVALRGTDGPLRGAYSPELARWMALALQADASVMHAACALVRHARLVTRRSDDQRTHEPGAWLRQIALLLRMLERSPSTAGLKPELQEELARLQATLASLATDMQRTQHSERLLYEIADLSIGHTDREPQSEPEPTQPILRAL